MTALPDGYRIEYTRRRYGSTTYTWVHIVTPDDRWLSTGDPIPAITPKRAEIEQRITRVLAEEATT